MFCQPSAAISTDDKSSLLDNVGSGQADFTARKEYVICMNQYQKKLADFEKQSALLSPVAVDKKRKELAEDLLECKGYE